MKPGAPILIEWVDAHFYVEPWTLHEREKPKVLKTFGVYVDADDTFLYYASTQDDHNTWKGRGAIPWGMVRDLWELLPVPQPHS